MSFFVIRFVKQKMFPFLLAQGGRYAKIRMVPAKISTP
ncbi:hypothetical protein SB48_HM08orf02215 [Heyndrickxia coagulans]|uniref:Uncharacterized protein n=1 Tax=Heyndrickxia coagulans TaxID=1398 RepID=A0AAN0T3J9_HEYCO|nr:hypothetical protein SB48_HM08orf02215 [Heyndrickxia coagulans]